MLEAKLYVVATPIGNLGDITRRALEVLRTVNVIFCEDTRETGKLLDLEGIPKTGKTFCSYAKHNLKESTEAALLHLQAGREVALVTDRGTPAVSDPGAELVSAARQGGIPVVPIPGVSAITTLMSAAGMDRNDFLFVGFPPTQMKERESLWQKVGEGNFPTVLFESPHRIVDTLNELKGRFPAGRVFLGRELTKSYEQFLWIVLRDWEATQPGFEMLGEFALVLVPDHTAKGRDHFEEALRLRLVADKEWAKWAAQEFGVKTSDAYDALQRGRGKKL